MKNQFEIIKHSHMKNLNIFLVNMNYRSPHLHREFEIILVIKGNVEITSKSENYNLTSGCCVIFNPNQPHEIKSCSDNNLLLCLQISPKFCYHYFPQMSNLVFDSCNIKNNTSHKTYKNIQSLIFELSYLYYEKRDNYEFSCMSKINLLFHIILNNLPYHIVSNEEKLASIQKTKRLTKILNYIDENYMYKLRLSDIAKNENLSTSYLSHFIKDNLNQSFQEYLNNCRFNHAKELLLSKDMKLIDICFECGFSDYRYLYKTFRQHYNCTPYEYRDLHKQFSSNQNSNSHLSHENFYSEDDALSILNNI